MCKTTKFFIIFIAQMVIWGPAFAQQPSSPEEQEKQMYEMTQKTVDRYAEDYKLEDWQIFYVDSIFMTNNRGLMVEIQKMQAQMVTNADLYKQTQDKWTKKTEEALKKVFNPEQWEKYLKQTGEKKKKSKDKKQNK